MNSKTHMGDYERDLGSCFGEHFPDFPDSDVKAEGSDS